MQLRFEFREFKKASVKNAKQPQSINFHSNKYLDCIVSNHHIRRALYIQAKSINNINLIFY